MLEAIPDTNDSQNESMRAAADAKACADNGDWDGARAAMARAIDLASDNAGYHALMAWYTYQCSLQPAFERPAPGRAPPLRGVELVSPRTRRRTNTVA
jgi:hypothetical protein